MKKVFLTLVCAVVALTASAQRASSSSSSFFSTETSDQPITFGIRAGVNFANVSLSGDEGSYSPKSRTGFNVGVAVDFPLLESFYIQSGLYYTTKGYEFDTGSHTETASPAYLEIPILASYRYDFSENAQLQVNFGPYLAYGVGGKLKYESQSHGSEESDFFDDDDINKFDAGLQVGAGVTIAKHYYIGCAYEFGLTNIWKDSDDEKLKNSNFFINVGYTF